MKTNITHKTQHTNSDLNLSDNEVLPTTIDLTKDEAIRYNKAKANKLNKMKTSVGIMKQK